METRELRLDTHLSLALFHCTDVSKPYTDVLANMPYLLSIPHPSLSHLLTHKHTHAHALTHSLPCRATRQLSSICQCYSWGNGDLGHEWWVLLQKWPRPKPLGKPPNPFMRGMNKYTNNNSQPNIWGAELMANYCVGIWGMGSAHFIMPTPLCNDISIMHSAEEGEIFTKKIVIISYVQAFGANFI